MVRINIIFEKYLLLVIDFQGNLCKTDNMLLYLFSNYNRIKSTKKRFGKGNGLEKRRSLVRPDGIRFMCVYRNEGI